MPGIFTQAGTEPSPTGRDPKVLFAVRAIEVNPVDRCQRAIVAFE